MDATRTHCTIYEINEECSWIIPLDEFTSQEKQEKEEQLRGELQRVILQSSVKDQICWDRSLHGFFVKSIYQFLQGALYHETQLANI
jgi:hypothetical protein